MSFHLSSLTNLLIDWFAYWLVIIHLWLNAVMVHCFQDHWPQSLIDFLCFYLRVDIQFFKSFDLLSVLDVIFFPLYKTWLLCWVEATKTKGMKRDRTDRGAKFSNASSLSSLANWWNQRRVWSVNHVTPIHETTSLRWTDGRRDKHGQLDRWREKHRFGGSVRHALNDSSSCCSVVVLSQVLRSYYPPKPL